MRFLEGIFRVLWEMDTNSYLPTHKKSDLDQKRRSRLRNIAIVVIYRSHDSFFFQQELKNCWQLYMNNSIPFQICKLQICFSMTQYDIEPLRYRYVFLTLMVHIWWCFTNLHKRRKGGFLVNWNEAHEITIHYNGCNDGIYIQSISLSRLFFQAIYQH